MREILFRGKRKDNGEWAYGDLEHNGKGEMKWVNGDEIIPETVGQFTGLTDKNGKKIFEGDIVKGCLSIVFSIYFDLDYLQFRAELSDGTERNIDYYGNSEKLEVIGNIFDNPELFGE